MRLASLSSLVLLIGLALPLAVAVQQISTKNVTCPLPGSQPLEITAMVALGPNLLVLQEYDSDARLLLVDPSNCHILAQVALPLPQAQVCNGQLFAAGDDLATVYCPGPGSCYPDLSDNNTGAVFTVAASSHNISVVHQQLYPTPMCLGAQAVVDAQQRLYFLLSYPSSTPALQQLQCYTPATGAVTQLCSSEVPTSYNPVLSALAPDGSVFVLALGNDTATYFAGFSVATSKQLYLLPVPPFWSTGVLAANQSLVLGQTDDAVVLASVDWTTGNASSPPATLPSLWWSGMLAMPTASLGSYLFVLAQRNGPSPINAAIAQLSLATAPAKVVAMVTMNTLGPIATTESFLALGAYNNGIVLYPLV